MSVLLVWNFEALLDILHRVYFTPRFKWGGSSGSTVLSWGQWRQAAAAGAGEMLRKWWIWTKMNCFFKSINCNKSEENTKCVILDKWEQIDMDVESNKDNQVLCYQTTCNHFKVWDLRSSEMLRSVNWYLITDVLGQSIAHIFKRQACNR